MWGCGFACCYVPRHSGTYVEEIGLVTFTEMAVEVNFTTTEAN